MAGKDIIRFSILEDGTVTIETDGVSGPNHVSADQLLAEIADAVGGTTEKKRRTKVEMHSHLGQTQSFQDHIADGHSH